MLCRGLPLELGTGKSWGKAGGPRNFVPRPGVPSVSFPKRRNPASTSSALSSRPYTFVLCFTGPRRSDHDPVPMAEMTEQQNGMDILCDAVGSDLLLGSFLASSPPPEQRPKRAKVAADDAESSSTSPHVCHICRRVYERYGCTP